MVEKSGANEVAILSSFQSEGIYLGAYGSWIISKGCFVKTKYRFSNVFVLHSSI